MLFYDKDPSAPILDNRFGITDEKVFREIESDFAQQRTYELLSRPFVITAENFEVNFREIHRYMFQDVYEWAGTYRDVMISKEGSNFSRPEEISRDMDELVQVVKENNYCDGTDCDLATIAFRIAHISDALNYIHPFREGNGRAKHIFLQMYALSVGYILDYSKISEEVLLRAEISANHSVTDEISVLVDLHKRCLSKDRGE